jgi:hypothetical protein
MLLVEESNGVLDDCGGSRGEGSGRWTGGVDWVGGRAEGIDSERMGRMRQADGPCAARGWDDLCGRGERGGGMVVVYTIVLIVSRDLLYRNGFR